MKQTLEIVTELLKHMDLKRDPADATVSYLEIDEIRFIFKDGKYVGWYNYKTGPEKPKNSQGEKSSEPSETSTNSTMSYMTTDILSDWMRYKWYHEFLGEKSSEPSKTVTKEMFSDAGHIIGHTIGEANLKDSNGYWNLKIAFKTTFESEGYEVLNFDSYETDSSTVVDVIILNPHNAIMQTISFSFQNMKVSDFSNVSIDVISEWVRFKWRQKFFD